LKYRQLGNSRLTVSEIAFGSWLAFSSSTDRSLSRAQIFKQLEASLKRLLRQPNVAAAIIGASRPEQVDENAAASGQMLAPELFEDAERIMGDASRLSRAS
jgi:aryl-alcohol dehydrogenase-like predicted oxidoreductase